MSAKYNAFVKEFSEDLKDPLKSNRVEIMTMDGGHIIENYDKQLESKDGQLIITNVQQTKKIMVLYDEHIIGFKLR